MRPVTCPSLLSRSRIWKVKHHSSPFRWPFPWAGLRVRHTLPPSPRQWWMSATIASVPVPTRLRIAWTARLLPDLRYQQTSALCTTKVCTPRQFQCLSPFCRRVAADQPLLLLHRVRAAVPVHRRRVLPCLLHGAAFPATCRRVAADQPLLLPRRVGAVVLSHCRRVAATQQHHRVLCRCHGAVFPVIHLHLAGAPKRRLPAVVVEVPSSTLTSSLTMPSGAHKAPPLVFVAFAASSSLHWMMCSALLIRLTPPLGKSLLPSRRCSRVMLAGQP